MEHFGMENPERINGKDGRWVVIGYSEIYEGWEVKFYGNLDDYQGHDVYKGKETTIYFANRFLEKGE